MEESEGEEDIAVAQVVKAKAFAAMLKKSGKFHALMTPACG